MKKFRSLLIIGVIALSTRASAQESPYLGIFGGYTFPSGVFTNPANFSYKPVYNAGIFAEFDRLYHLYINTGLVYSQEETGPVTLTPEVAHPKDFSSNFTYNYAQAYLRLKWSYPLINHVSVYYSGGIYAGYLISGNYIQDGNTIDASNDMHHANGGILGGVGITLLASKLKVTLGVDGNYGFFYTIKDLPYRGTFYAAGLRTSLGLSYPLVNEQ